MNYGSLFVSEAYLQALLDSACVTPAQGWLPLGVQPAPLYLKQHSYGEFVFDFAFANAYAEHGLNYYPKLIAAVPFTPVTGPRLGGLSGPALQELMREQGASSTHLLFLPPAEARELVAQGWLLRQDVRFVWKHRGYAGFDDFLAALASKKRKNLRAERRKVEALGLDVRWQAAAEFSATEWSELYALYAATYLERGQTPYLNLECLRAWGRRLPAQFLFCVARRNTHIEAMAFFFRDEEVLYGRHWGSRIAADCLHFELCYYRGIEYCIEQGLRTFDAGVQGGHRLLRGFEPEWSQSVHWFDDERFHRAIASYLARERSQCAEQFSLLCERTAFAQRQSAS